MKKFFLLAAAVPLMGLASCTTTTTHVVEVPRYVPAKPKPKPKPVVYVPKPKPTRPADFEVVNDYDQRGY